MTDISRLNSNRDLEPVDPYTVFCRNEYGGPLSIAGPFDRMTVALSVWLHVGRSDRDMEFERYITSADGTIVIGWTRDTRFNPPIVAPAVTPSLVQLLVGDPLPAAQTASLLEGIETFRAIYLKQLERAGLP